MDLAEKKLALFDAHLSHKGLQHLVDCAAALFGNPLFMADMSMVVVCKSSDMGDGQTDWSASNDLDRQMGAVRQAADAGFMDWIYHHDQPVIGEFAGQPRYLSARVRDGGQVLGHVVVVETGRAFEADDEALLPVFCQTLSYELRRTSEGEFSQEVAEPLLHELISGTTRQESDVRRLLKELGYVVPPSVRLLLLSQTDTRHVVSATFLRAQLKQAFRGSVGIMHEGSCLQVIDGSLGVQEVTGTLDSSVYMGGLSASLSRPFREVTLLDQAYKQADAALRLSELAGESVMVTYDDVWALHLRELAMGDDVRSWKAFVPPELQLLKEFDVRDKTEYVQSLAAYLNCGRNVARAARALHVHKNSMYYRVQRIEELVGIDLSDERICFLLQMALALEGIGPTSYGLEQLPNHSV